MKNLTKHIFIILLGLILLSTPAIVTNIQAQSGGDFAINRSTIDGGGQASSGGDFVINGTIGQMDSTSQGALTGDDFSLTGGFWATVSSSGGGQVFYLPIIVKN